MKQAMTEWSTFYLKVGRKSVGAKWTITENASRFPNAVINQLVALTILKMCLWLPRSHGIEIVLARDHDKDAVADHCGTRIYWERGGVREGKAHRGSSITIHDAHRDRGDVLLSAIQFMRKIAHELEHARQYCYRTGNGKPGRHGDRHEYLANRATENMLVQLAFDKSALTELRRICQKARR